VRCLEKELGQLGLNLAQDFVETEQELQVAPIEPRLYSQGSRALLQAGQDLGYALAPMPKFIDAKKCRKCGQCIYGCVHGAKWTSLTYLHEALDNGAEILCNTRVQQVLVAGGRARGVVVKNRQGVQEIAGKAVVLAAGGIGTPVILQNSGVKEAGGNLFIDPLIITYGITDDARLSQVHEPSMTFVDLEFHQSQGMTPG